MFSFLFSLLYPKHWFCVLSKRMAFVCPTSSRKGQVILTRESDFSWRYNRPMVLSLSSPVLAPLSQLPSSSLPDPILSSPPASAAGGGVQYPRRYVRGSRKWLALLWQSRRRTRARKLTHTLPAYVLCPQCTACIQKHVHAEHWILLPQGADP